MKSWRVMKNSNLESVIIITGSDAPSFCHYHNDKGITAMMPVVVLEKSIAFCESNHLTATILYGRTLPDKHRLLLNDFPHIRMVPFDRMDSCDMNYESDIVIIDYNGDLSAFENMEVHRPCNVILKMNLEEAKDLPRIVYQYHKIFKRLNVVFKDIPHATEETLNRFRLDIQPLKEVMYSLFIPGRLFEFNMVTDRMALSGINSCGAGIKHVTVAPDGRFYICPAFYYHNENESAGTLDDGITIANRQLLTIEYSPICKLCDCYQCKRCVYLNKKLTRELNTPSHQQCVLSHHERNLSGVLLQKLQDKGYPTNIKSIPPVYHLDPLELFKDRK
jgi:CXXX repeat peptide maturase